MYKGFNRVVVIVDDIPVYGHTKEDYNRNLFVKVPLEWSPAQLQEESAPQKSATLDIVSKWKE